MARRLSGMRDLLAYNSYLRYLKVGYFGHDPPLGQLWPGQYNLTYKDR